MKIGDRVKVNESSTYFVGREGVISSETRIMPYDWMVKIDNNNGHNSLFSESELEVIE